VVTLRLQQAHPSSIPTIMLQPGILSAIACQKLSFIMREVAFRGRYESEIRSGSGGDESSVECRSPDGEAHGPCQRFFRHQDDSRRANRLREGERHYSGHIRQDLAR